MLVFWNQGHLDLFGYSNRNALEWEEYLNLDWLECPIGLLPSYCVFLGGNIVLQKSKRQLVSHSSDTKTNYQVRDDVTGKLPWIKMLVSCSLQGGGVSNLHFSILHCFPTLDKNPFHSTNLSTNLLMWWYLFYISYHHYVTVLTN